MLGVRKSATRPTKREAQNWATEEEARIRSVHSSGIDDSKTVNDAFDRYKKDVSPQKKGTFRERTRLDYLSKISINGINQLGDMRLSVVSSDFFAQWRDFRINTEKKANGSVTRDLWLISSVFKYAVKEWKWCKTNPLQDVKKPSEAPPRDRRISQDEIDRICTTLGFNGIVTTKLHRVAVAFLFAIETAMRAGEIVGLKWKDITKSVATLHNTKNGTSRRVPLSTEAQELLALLHSNGPESLCFELTTSSLDVNFRQARDRADIQGLRFHDTRHEAITRLAKRIDVLDLARMVGHRDIRMLQIYYNETAEEIAEKLKA